MKQLAIYGLCGGVLIVAMRFVEYRFLVIGHSVEIYAALIAAAFAAIGIWFGITLTGRKVEVREVTVEVPVASNGPFVADMARIETLGITPRELVENPFMNAAMTFTEPFPVGLLITVISAAVLRKKES